MFWPIVIFSEATSAPKSSVKTDINSPYIFSIYVEYEGNEEKLQAGINYEFLIEGAGTKHYLQLVFFSEVGLIGLSQSP